MEPRPDARPRSPLAVVRRFLSEEAYRRQPDAALWRLFRDHADGDALRVLLERIGGRLAGRCRAVTGDPALADDALQETLVQLVRHRRRLGEYPQAVAWLYRTADSRARMLLRSRRRSERREGVAARPEAVDDRPPSDADALLAAVAGLPARERRVVELVYLEGMTHAEAAAALGLGVGSVGKYAQRGVGRLRGRLGAGAVLAAGGLAPGRAAALAATALARGAAPRGLPLLAACGLAAAGGVGWVAARGTPPPAAAVAPPSAAPEPLPARNLRLFDADVRPHLQAALDGMAVGDGGHAVVTAAEAHGARLWVSAEVRHGPPQSHVTRLELMYDTFDRSRRFFEDTLGVWRTINPRDPLAVARNRLGIPDLTRPSTGLRDVEAAFRRLPADPRAAVGTEADRRAMHAAMARYVGDWGGGRAVRPPAGGFKRDGGAAEFAGGPVSGLYWCDLRVRADGAVVALHPGLQGPAVFSADGRRINWGDGRGWVRETSTGGD